MKLEELIDICIYKKNIVSFVGAGGKTTLMYMIADRAAKAGKKVIVATTTHILKPDTCYANNLQEVKRLWVDGCYAVVGEIDDANAEKIVFPTKELFEEIKAEADLVLLEADGAKKFPCKIPAAHEPMILEDCDCVVGIMGMSALGRKMKDCCFRFDLFGKWLNSGADDIVNDDTVLDEEIASMILTSDFGTKKSVGARDYYVVLNQCDDENTMRRAKLIADKLCNSKIDTICCSLMSSWGRG